ncbi:hypothetical protein C7B61_14945 [filamentous cyanobacterium CCP1]|nr:hypothetical protein C7B61_14945 [filamentous cyanobacterium CCP1]
MELAEVPMKDTAIPDGEGRRQDGGLGWGLSVTVIDHNSNDREEGGSLGRIEDAPINSIHYG